MPLIHQSIQPLMCQLAVWEITEGVTELRSCLALNLEHENELNLRQTENGKKGYLAVRKALTTLGPDLQELIISPEGAPELSQNYCSFSHTQHYAVAVVGQQSIGVDIEVHRPKIERIAKKFVHKEEEVHLLKTNPIAWLTRLWTAKEAIYKAMRQPGISLAEEIVVAPFTLSEKEGTATVFIQGESHKLHLQFFTFDQHQLTIAQPIQI